MDDMPTNHDEALTFANMKCRDSNLARCYLAREAELTALREALGMAEHQQHEVAKALRLEPTGDSVYVHYQIMAVLDALRASLERGDGNG